MAILDAINSPEDIRKLSLNELRQLAREIRDLIITTTAHTGGHLAPNLGVVELTLALHYVFNTPEDRIVWDVGHQCYTHKIITGRKERFGSLRQYGGIAGFPKRAESVYDVFDTGHSGNSISVSLGMVTADYLLGSDKRHTVAVIGDGSIVTGMALEALNHAGMLKRDIIVVLNDNEMSIARSTGAIAAYLNRMITGKVYNRIREDAWLLLGHLPKDLSDRARLAARKLEEGLKSLVVPSLLFEELGFRYIGPIDGHSIPELIETFRRVKGLKGPVLVHAVTKKGQGYPIAMAQPEQFHGIGPFDVTTGESKAAAVPTFTDSFGKKIVELAEQNPKVVTITAGMCLGTGLKLLRDRFPDRFFDVGICEQHAVSFAAGLALNGLKPVVAIYSTFLMRAIDQLLQDVCLQNLPVVFAVDRAGLVGEDGPTHHGVYDLSYLTMLPNITIFAPRDELDMERMLEYAVQCFEGPIALRYPRGGSGFAVPSTQRSAIVPGKGELLRPGKDGAVLAVGSMVKYALEAADVLVRQGLDLAVADARSVKPLDEELVAALAQIKGKLVTIEENTLLGGFGNVVSLALEKMGLDCQLRRIGVEDRFIEHGPRSKLLKVCGLDVDSIAVKLKQFFG
ncbi:MAG: 1-deoxy-D-xylulose-5-phosphate synthase [candidate division WOR-3 bacterium]|jgi:1-deoxy-D-xylulose-5-phosphate synthase|nr:1-deoxy-D-xylulose-5-phosphate synthase [candidate division WOR-3 bacterium]MDH7518491.1 1-deoxy-D-xylulose-5-phosphate synthase [bacterium]